jgi:hypothetical protein
MRWRFQTAWDLLVRGGPFWQWKRDTEPFSTIIQNNFRPELCYATFGNLDALNIARELAQRCQIPWVMDIKDPAAAFLPKCLRPLLMRRYRDANAVTLNANFQRKYNKGWCNEKTELIYSGVESCAIPDAVIDPNLFALVGAVYDDASLFRLMAVFRRHVLESNSNARIIYYGKEVERVKVAARTAGVLERVDCAGMVDRLMMLRECSTAVALFYVGYAGTFHHKLLELAALGRPLIACPDESEESRDLMTKYKHPFYAGADEHELLRAMNTARLTKSADTRQLLEDMDWSAVTTQLERVLIGAITTLRAYR